MPNNPIKITDEEVAQYREQFSQHQEALDALDLIIKNRGNLIESTNLLVLEAGLVIYKNAPNILEELAQRCRNVICNDVFIDNLMAGLLTAGLTSLAASGQIPLAVATPVVIYLAKIGVKKWCDPNRN